MTMYEALASTASPSILDVVLLALGASLAAVIALAWARVQARRHGPAILTAGALAACRTEPLDAPADASTVDAIDAGDCCAGGRCACADMAPAPDLAPMLDFSTVDTGEIDGGKCGTVGDVCATRPCCVGAVILKCCSDSICALDCP